MSATKASFERVREAVYFLERQGEKPSASRVRELLDGGSKSTILGHMQTLYAQIAAQPRSSGMAEAFMMKTATKLVEEVWAEAAKLASPELEERLNTLAHLNDALNEGLQDLFVENEALRQRIEELEVELRSVEEKAADAAADLAGRRELEAHLTELSRLVNHLKRGVPMKAAMLQAIQLVAETQAPMGRSELYRRMLSMGYPNRSAQQARKNIISNGYAEERGNPPLLFLLQEGHDRLLRWQQEQSGQAGAAA